MISAYRSLFTSRRVLEVWASSLLGRLQLGTLPLGIIFCVQGRGGSIALAGAAVAVNTLAAAISAPYKGRVIDRVGVRPVILLLSLAHLLPIALLCFAPLTWSVALSACFIAGLLRTNLTTYMRVLWREIHRAEDLRERASALEAATSPIITISGPAFAGGLYALVGGPEALLITTLVTSLGALLFALSGLQASPSAERVRGAMPWRALIMVLPVGVLSQAALGAMQVAVPEWASEQGSLAASGILLSCLGLGSLAGGLVYGAVRWRTPQPARLPYLALALALFSAPLFLSSGWAETALLLFLVGGPVTGMIASIQYVMQDISPRGMDTEVLSWWVTTSAAGVAAGNALSGVAASISGASSALLLVFSFSLGALLLSFVAAKVN